MKRRTLAVLAAAALLSAQAFAEEAPPAPAS